MEINSFISDLFECIRELNTLPWSEKEHLANIFAQRTWLISHKLSKSPFNPVKEKDRLRLNSSFPEALKTWAWQFSEKNRLGAIALGLSINYITEDELKNFLDTCAIEFNKEKSDRRKIVPYALTDRTDIYGRLVHRIGAKGTSDRDVKMPGPLETFIHTTSYSAYMEAAGTPVGPGYYELKGAFTSLLNSNYVIIEDWSLTGKTMSAEIKDLITIFNLLLGRKDIQKKIEDAEYLLPTLTIILPFATETALDRIRQTFSTNPVSFAITPRIICGFKFEDNNRLSAGCEPQSFKVFKDCTKKINWGKCAENACKEYSDNAFQCLKIEERQKVNINFKKTLKYGYGKSGWLIIGFDNCPDNTLPLFWRPCELPNDDDFIPLFPRVESKVTHLGTGEDIRSNLEYARKHPRLLNRKIEEIVRGISG